MIKNRNAHQVSGMAKPMVLTMQVDSNVRLGKVSHWQIIVQKEF